MLMAGAVSCLVLLSCLWKVRKVCRGKWQGKEPEQAAGSFEHQSTLSQLYPIIYGLLVDLIFLLQFLFRGCCYS